MNVSLLRGFASLLAALSLLPSAVAQPQPARVIPDSLKPWEQWATWNDRLRDAPPTYQNAKAQQAFWPSRLGLQVDKSGARFELSVTAFADTWVPLPGGADAWPVEVKANGTAVPVVEQKGLPSIRLTAGTWKIEGAYRWSEIPQRLFLPKEIGILALSIEGKSIEAPVWDASGALWLKRDGSTEETDKDFLSSKIHAQLEDGIPLWWRVEIELVVSGKSREEELGNVLPEGWKIASAEGPLPLAVDEAGQLKVQVRAGKWILKAEAFRSDNPKEIRYAAGAKPAAEVQFVAFQARPEFRLIELTGAPSIDVSQATFPDRWRALPVYRWETGTVLKIEERLRGMGQQKPAGLSIARELWLDENGRGLTFRDRINGSQQQTWRLDAAAGQDLGSVRAAGRGQLITRNPQTKAPGVELRSRNVALEATGRMARTADFSASGWRVDADNVSATLHLPPGWRLFALFGADYVRGDWLTAWTLLDLFLVLIFTLAVFRLFGLLAAGVALVGFVLSYHEPDAPRALWLCVLAAVALAKFAPAGWMQRVAGYVRWGFVGLLLLALIPFVTQQVQQAIYPQLERVRGGGQMPNFFGNVAGETKSSGEEQRELIADFDAGEQGNVNQAAPVPQQEARVPAATRSPATSIGNRVDSIVLGRKGAERSLANLQFDSKARIQTGPGVPEWTWRTATFGWNGPVTVNQEVRPIYIPLWLQRLITVARVALLLLLAALLLDPRRLAARFAKPLTTAAPLLLIAFGLGFAPGSARAEFPDQTMLDALRARLLETPDAFPRAAEIPSVQLTLAERRLTMEAEIHVAARCSVPLPGRFPVWSPISVQVDGKPEAALRRDDGFLWVVLTEGIHRVRVEGLVSEATDWEWTFQLKPRRVKIEAPGWTWTGVKPDGTPESQIFFAQKQKAAASATAAYDRKDFQALMLVDREIEFGLQWQVRTKVSRLSAAGKAVALRIPLLPGESVLTAGAVVKDGFIEVRLGAQQDAFEWESGLEPSEKLALATRTADTWVERWSLVASPVWNVTLSGLPPVFEAGNSELTPVWKPWPGENVAFAVSRPEAIAGATVTVRRATREIALGKRLRTTKLTLQLNCSLGEDFAVGLPAAAEVTGLTSNGKSVPVRKDGARVIIPLRPGEQTIVLDWKLNEELGLQTRAEEVRLPVESANIETTLRLPADRWPLWVDGPLRGPAVRFWGILLCAGLAAYALSRAPKTPLTLWEWLFLAIGLTQASVFGSLVVVAWLFALRWRGNDEFTALSRTRFNFAQVGIIGLTLIALLILIGAVASGLLGTPEMFITGNGSGRTALRWSQARGEAVLPQPGVLTVSIWWYRFFMLAWALWLAAALLRWLRWGWENANKGGFFRPAEKPAEIVPPPLPAEVPGSAGIPAGIDPNNK